MRRRSWQATSAASAAARDASQPPQDASAQAAAAALPPEAVARIDDALVIGAADLDRYLGTVYARLPEGDLVLHQLVTESLIEHDGTDVGGAVTDAEIEAARAELEQQAVAAGAPSLSASLGDNVPAELLVRTLRLLVLNQRLVRSWKGLPPDAPVDAAQLQEWIDGRLSTANVQPAPLDDPLAATLEIGTITKAAVGARLRSVLRPDTISGVLTEMIGVLLVRRKADALGIDLTPAAATREILDRDAVLRSRAGVGDVTYTQYVETVQKRSLAELLQSDKFSTEVLLRLIVERDWTEESARKHWESDRAGYATLGDGDWESVRAGVWRDLRQRAYRQLFEESRIVRRF